MNMTAADLGLQDVLVDPRLLPEFSAGRAKRTVRYGLGCLATALRFRFARWGLVPPFA